MLEGPFTVCIDAAAGQKLWHYEDGAWVDITNRVLDGGTITPAAGKVCGMVNDFSPFAVASATLPATGADSGGTIGAAALAGALLLAGTATMVAVRRRHS